MRSVAVPVHATVDGNPVVETRSRQISHDHDPIQTTNPMSPSSRLQCKQVAIRRYPIILPHELAPWLLSGLNADDLRDTIGSRQAILDYWKHHPCRASW